MKKSPHILAFILNIFFAYPQIYKTGAFAHENFVDSVLNQLQNCSNDTSKVNFLTSLADYYLFIRQDSPVYYLERAIELAEKINYPDGRYAGYVRLAYALNYSSNYAEALNNALKSLKIAEKLKSQRLESMATSYGMMALINFRNHFDTLSLEEDRQSIALYKQAGLSAEKAYWGPYGQIALVYTQQNHLDSALIYAMKAYDISLNAPPRGRSQISVTSTFVANVYERMGNYQLARYYFLCGIEADKKFNAPLLRVRIFNNFARFYKNIGKLDSCIYYAEIAYQSCQNHQFGEHAVDAAGLVAQTYEKLGNADSALKYMKIFVAAKDTIFNQSKLLRIQVLNFDEGQRQKDIQREIDEAKERYLNKVRFYSLLATVAIFVLLTVILYRNKRHKLIANRTLESQKMAELQQQKTELEMQALRAQMNPHFIFNSLNSINHFILQNNKVQASEFLTKFSKLVRMILQNSQASTITLESELEALKLYLEMEALRFDYHFDYKISVPKDLDIEVLRVPPLIIQPYVENAIWHGLMHKEEKGKLDIEVSQEGESLFFKISDNGIGRKQAAILASKSATKHKSMALRITAARIAFLQNTNGIESPVTINDLVDPDGAGAGTVVIIKIPVIYD